MKSLGAIGISGAGLNTAIGKLEPLLAGIVFESSLIGRRENLFGLNRFQKRMV